MTQLEIGQVTSGSDSAVNIDPAKLDKAVVQYRVGSILNVADHALPPDKWHEIIGAIQAKRAKNAVKDSGHLRHRFDPRRQLRAGRDAFSARDRHGRDVEPGVDATSRRDRRDGNRAAAAFPGAFRRCLISAASRCGRAFGKPSAKIRISRQ